MDRRLILHKELIKVLGNNNVYFQPPESLKMHYPCIRYSKTRPKIMHADNTIYINKRHYELTVIDEDPDTQIGEKLMNAFPYCSINNQYNSHNLTHIALDLYY